ncbi:MAG: type II toxin-antitoxin system Phd/YefM family antitoxin [SAR324 cluster bacterium]|nr:type II toxin-antitoxin system Phd/YefM family antitoxin [SAR324 cluster bacterium]
MTQVNIHEAKTHLSRLIAEGEEVVIARYGEPVARLIPIRNKREPRMPGSAKALFEIPDSFFDPLPADVIDGFYG